MVIGRFSCRQEAVSVSDAALSPPVLGGLRCIDGLKARFPSATNIPLLDENQRGYRKRRGSLGAARRPPWNDRDNELLVTMWLPRDICYEQGIMNDDSSTGNLQILLAKDVVHASAFADEGL